MPSTSRQSVQGAEQKECERDEQHGDDRDERDVAAAPNDAAEAGERRVGGRRIFRQSFATRASLASGRRRFPCAAASHSIIDPAHALLFCAVSAAEELSARLRAVADHLASAVHASWR